MNCSNHSTSGSTMKLRLFALRDSHTLKIVPNMFFSGKPEAKRARDELNAGTARYVVTPGPDHRKAK